VEARHPLLVAVLLFGSPEAEFEQRRTLMAPGNQAE
jgi:hypothetical protein